MLLFHIEKGDLRERNRRRKIKISKVRQGESFQKLHDVLPPQQPLTPSQVSLNTKRSREKFSNCLSHQNHFNEHDMHNNRSFRIIIIFFRSDFRLVWVNMREIFYHLFSSSSLNRATTQKKDFPDFPSRNGIRIRISSSSNPPMLCDNL
jgi:hypothetical protein